MASWRVVRVLVCLMIVLGVSAAARGYTMQGLDITVDYWAGAGSNETIVVIDWNRTNGPYATESHAWGFRWEGSAYVSDALAAIDSAVLWISQHYTAGRLSATHFITIHRSITTIIQARLYGWWWAGDTIDGGLIWNGNDAGINTEFLSNGRIEGLNLDDLTGQVLP